MAPAGAEKAQELLPKPATIISNHSARKIGKRSVRFGMSAYIEVWLEKPQRNFEATEKVL